MHVRMKNRPAILLLSFCLLFSCDRTIDRALNNVEIQLQISPKEALQCISTIAPNDIYRKSNKARYALLYSMALDKNYIDVANDSIVQIAVEYYNHRGPKRYRMLSEYSLGRIQINSGNKAGAIVSLLKAKDLAYELEDLHYIGLSARNIAQLYGSSYDENTELRYYKELYAAFDMAGEENYAVYSKVGEATAHLSLGESDLADSLYHEVIPYAESHNSTLLSTILKDLALLEISPHRKNPEKALSYYQAVSRLPYARYSTADYGAIALSYEFLNKPDSVKKYLALAEGCTLSLLDSVQLCNTKLRIYNNRNALSEANQQMQLGVDLHNKLVYSHENLIIANAISDYRHQEALQQASLAKNRLLMIALLSFAMLSLVCLVFQQLKIHRQQISEKNRLIREKEEKIEDDITHIREISDELQAASAAQSELTSTVNSLIRERITFVKKCADAYEYVKSTPRTNPKDPYKYLDQDPINSKTEEINTFIRSLETFRKDDSLFSLLETNVNKWRNGIMTKLRSACSRERMKKPQFDDEDFRLLMLFYAGIPDKTIAFLMNMTCPAVRTRKTRYKERLSQNDIENGVFFVDEIGRSI